MTGQEVIKLIGTLRRIPGEELDKMIANLSIRLYFLHDLDNQIKSYNNNSVRKLAAAVAMIGKN
jgi:ABC-type multidrug transport system ATPase subunit